MDKPPALTQMLPDN